MLKRFDETKRYKITAINPDDVWNQVEEFFVGKTVRITTTSTNAQENIHKSNAFPIGGWYAGLMIVEKESPIPFYFAGVKLKEVKTKIV